MKTLRKESASQHPSAYASHARTGLIGAALGMLVCLMTAPAFGHEHHAQGIFTAKQAAQGQELYAAHCASCHGTQLDGAVAGALKGQAFASSWNNSGSWGTSKMTVDDLDFVIRHNMPRNAPGSLDSTTYTDILAYVLQQNGYAAGSEPLMAGSRAMKKTPLRFTAAAAQAMPAPPQRIQGAPDAVPRGGGPTQQQLDNAAASTRDWLYQTHDYDGSRYAPLSQINVENAGKLHAVCAFQTGGKGSYQTHPIEYRGTIYITTLNMTFALDASNCRPKWKYTWTPRAHEVWQSNRGVAIKDGYVVRGTSDGYLLALNATTGKLVWAVRAADSGMGQTFTMAPLIYKDLVIIGPAGSENGISGWVGAFRLKDGSPVWKFHTVPGATRKGSGTWGNPHGIKLGGGAVWTPFTLDTRRGILFVAVTNPAPDIPAKMRPGANLYTNSVVALAIRTGTLLWYRQMVPNDSHDWDLTQVSPLFRARVDGRMQDLLATVGKDGILRTLERRDHKVLYATPVTTLKNTRVPVTSKPVTVCPGVLGGVEWNGPALSRPLNMLYVNAVDWCTSFSASDAVRYIPSKLYMGGNTVHEKSSQGWLTAIHASTGKVAWKYRSDRPMVSAVTATQGNVLFTGDLDGNFLVFDARNGKILYRFNTGGSIGGGVSTYEDHGKQYVAVTSGTPSAFWVNQYPGAPTLFLFALP